jgi:hypothetical protein
MEIGCCAGNEQGFDEALLLLGFPGSYHDMWIKQSHETPLTRESEMSQNFTPLPNE